MPTLIQTFSLAMQDWSHHSSLSPSLVKYASLLTSPSSLLIQSLPLSLLHHMEKKESTASSHVGMCQKLFNAFNPASRPHRRLDFHHQEPETTIPSPTQPNHSLDPAGKEPSPQNALPTPVKPRPATLDQKKPSEAIAPKAEPKPKNPPPPPPPPKPTSVSVQKVPDKLASTSTPPKATTLPQPAPPKAAATPQPVPLPAPPQGAAAAAKRPKKNINERVEDYIQRTKDRIRSISGVGRTPTS